MSRSKSKRSTPKYQRAKLCILPLLFAILGYVLLADSGTEDEQAALTPSPSQAASTLRQRPAATGTDQRGAQQAQLPDWSELASAHHRSECNPFLPIPKEEEVQEVQPEIAAELQSPESALAADSQPITEPIAEATAPAVDVTALSQQPVRYFFRTNNRRVMLVGDQLLSEGQTLDSYTVTRLEPDRIELEPASSDNTIH